MLYFAIVLIASIFLGLAVLTVKIVDKLVKSHQSQIYSLERTITARDKTITDLMNRLMSPDPKTYRLLTDISQKNQTSSQIDQMSQMNQESQILTHSTMTSSSDESEALRMAQYAGLGEPIYDDEYIDAMGDLGHNIARGA